MAIDGLILHSLKNNLQVLVGGKINKISQISDTEILLHIYQNRNNYQLFISGHSSYNRINLTTNKYQQSVTPSNFVMLLRKYLEDGYVTEITQTDLDRCLVITISNIDQLGDKVNYYFYIELMGKYANMILVNKDNRILHALKLIPPFANTKRTIQIGADFKLTEPFHKKNPFLENIEFDPALSLIEQFEGFSPLIEKEIYYRLNNEESLEEILKELKNSNTLYIYGEQFHLIPLTHLKKEPKILPIFQGLDYIYYSKQEKEKIRQQTGDLFKIVRKEKKKLQVKIEKLEASLQEAKEAYPYMEKGQLLYANLEKITKGMNKINLVSFETGEMIEIALDPKLDAKGNAKKCFQKYSKSKNALQFIPKQLEITNKELAYFNQLEYQLQSANYLDAKEIEMELIDGGFLRSKKKITTKKNKQAIPNYQQINGENFTIIYGKNNLQNEYVTWKKANHNDLWFHVKDGTGSHVILQANNPSEDIIRLAAMIAAYHSSYSQSSSIPVNWCPVKNLKKIPGSKIGLVSLSNYKTIYIDIDESIMKIDPQYIML